LPKAGYLLAYVFMRLFLQSFIFLMICSATSLAGQSGKLLTILSTGEDETQMMALVLTHQALEQGAEVTVLLCGEAGYLATEKGESKKFAPIDRSPRDLVRSLLSQGATVEICAIFLPNRDLDEDDLLKGVTVARPPEITRLLLHSDTHVLTF